MESPAVARALISVSDKVGLVDFARALAQAGVAIYSTGGTAQCLQEAGLTVQEVSSYTGFPEMLDGRLKTLHPKIFGGILARRDRTDDMASLAEHGIVPFELVVVNLYPFEATVARAGVTRDEAIEQIDIGGPSLVRAAAKNHAFVAIATHPGQYAAIQEEIARTGTTSRALRQRLAAEAFAHTAAYDRAIAAYFAKPESTTTESTTTESATTELSTTFPASLHLCLERKALLRYGENPHQGAALYAIPQAPGADLVSARQLNGKELSYNNLMDLDAALAIVRTLPDAAAVVIKHTNPCGAACAPTLAEAARHAMEGDPISAFGSILAFNQPVDTATAEYLATPGLFVEAMVAPHYDPAALEILTTRPKWKSNVRLMEVGSLRMPQDVRHYRHIDGGLLVQEADLLADEPQQWQVVTQTAPTPAQLSELQFAWAIARHVKSNAIVLSRNRCLCGAGAGQMSRVDSVDIAIRKAGDRAAGCVLASDAFFPFPDSIDRAAEAGIVAVIQPGGSRKDQEVIDACNARQLSMVFTGRRHFKH
ncbi:MAG: bifunctional phosphoribosylaminoimidazolecarboxamide formyltransferase/IMP cyclohydrolase [Planctomycetaceae bacterium]|nr:bifunctional phosphoribosylaminoimidazolecarboxamide formyltransferase/IMP cyclohydrolase [Planctomycetaceae bacterium]